MVMPRMIQDRSYLDDVFDNFMFPKLKESGFNIMKCDIYEKDNVYYLEMDIPGYDKNDVCIEIDDNDHLIITILKNSERLEEDENRNYIHKERSYGKCQRSFYIGSIDKEKVEAEFVNGILKVTMPKKIENEITTKKIDIK